MTSTSEQILSRLNELKSILPTLINEYKSLDSHISSEDRLALKKKIDSLFQHVDYLKKQYYSLQREERGFTKAQKKQIRKNFYDQVKDVLNGLGKRSENNVLFNNTIDFYTALKKGSLKDSLTNHKKCVDIEYTIMEELLENPVNTLVKYKLEGLESDEGNTLTKDSGESEIIRVVAYTINAFPSTRKNYLEMAMNVDARVGYWSINK